MATPQAQLCVSPEEYLKQERAAEERHEYDNGRINAMAGESPNHSRVCFSLAAVARSQLKGKSSEVFSPNMKTYVTAASKFYYPDLSVVCGQAGYHGKERDALLNPKVISANIHLQSIACQLPLAEIYDRVEFPPEEELQSDPPKREGE